MKSALSFLVFGLMTTSLFAGAPSQTGLTVAVINFADEERDSDYGEKVTALVTAELAGDTNLVMLDRGTLDKTLHEQAIGASGLVNSDTAARIGEITGVKVLVSGQVIRLEHDHLVIVANMVGTQTARLFAAKVEGSAKNLQELASDLSSKISRTILDDAEKLLGRENESKAERLERIVKSLHGANRPTVSVDFNHPGGPGHPSYTPNTEMGLILQKAGFTVVDANSDRKPDIEITGLVGVDGSTHGGLHTEHAYVEIKLQDRRTGAIIAMDRQESAAVDSTMVGAQRSAQALAVDELAERVLPLLAK